MKAITLYEYTPKNYLDPPPTQKIALWKPKRLKMPPPKKSKNIKKSENEKSYKMKVTSFQY